MDALLDESGCLNEVCNALKMQTPREAAKCNKQSQVPGESVGRGGECEFVDRVGCGTWCANACVLQGSRSSLETRR